MSVFANFKVDNALFSAVKALNRSEEMIEWMAYIMIGTAIVVGVLLQFVRAPYGRYSSSSWGWLLPGRLAWFLSELPSFVLGVWAILSGGPQVRGVVNVLLLVMFIVHYVQRTFIFPALIRGGKPTPAVPFLMALVFCIYNGYMQGYYLAHVAYYPDSWVTSPNFLVGVVMFFGGMIINIHGDHILRNLRKPGETGYRIPRGGMFNYVSGANFFGEICEWWGFALASWSLPATAFAIFTALNIGPRALSHHQWYKTKFGSDYPHRRMALIPFLL